MPEEVTYATLKFPNTFNSKKLQESCNLKRTDNHEEPELKLDCIAENGPGKVESTVEVAESRAIRGQSVPCKMRCPVAFALLVLNLVVLAGLGTLIFMNYQNFSSNTTAYDKQQNIIEQLKSNQMLYMDILKNISEEQTIFKNMLEDKLKELNKFNLTCCENFKQKKNDLKFCSCSKACIWHGDSGNITSILKNDKNWIGSQLFITCLPPPVSWMDLNCTLTKTNKKPKNDSEFCILTCLRSS